MLVQFIDQFMNSQMLEQDFEESILDIKKPDATQTKGFYVEALGVAVSKKIDIVHEILNIMNTSDKDVEQSIQNAKLNHNKPLETCLKILFTHSKDSKSESQG